MPAALPPFKLFDDLPQDIRDILREKMVCRAYKDEEEVWQAGDAPEAVYFILQGGACGFNLGKGGKVHVAVIWGAGGLIGHAACIVGLPRTENMSAYGESLLGRLDRETFLDLFTRVPRLAAYLHRLMALDIRNKIRISSARALLPAKNLVAFDLLMRQSMASSMELDVPFQKTWAATLDITRETLSRGLSALAKEGIISVDGSHIEIRDLEALKAAGMF